MHQLLFVSYYPRGPLPRRATRLSMCRLSSDASDMEGPGGSGQQGAPLEWWQAASTADIRTLTQLVRQGQVTNPSVSQLTTGRTALHLGVEAAKEMNPADATAVVSALFEMARGVGGASAQFRHREDLAQALLDAPDANGETALDLAKRHMTTPGGSAALTRLTQLGATERTSP